MHLTGIFLRPIFTEKSSLMSNEPSKKYMFVVHPNANKVMVKQVFQMIYGIVPTKINIINYKPVRVRTGTRKPGMSKARKVAVITLPKGATISIVGSKENSEAQAKK